MEEFLTFRATWP